jgi:dolichyl-phosphate-mannose-protein mannosyltransferase
VSKRTALICLVVIVALSAAVRLVNLGAFRDYVFDEYYYAHDAASLIHNGLGSPDWRGGGLREQSHPLFGDETIAVGIAALGDNPWGWRIMSALAGVVLIGLVYPTARRLLMNRTWAVVAAALAACDTLLIAASRVAMLDGLVALWSVVCVYCALRAARAPAGRRWHVLCGLAAGLAVSTKWSGALAVLAALVVLLVWRRRGSYRTVAASAVLLLATSLAVYVLTYAPYFAAGHGFGQWLQLQHAMATHGWGLTHPDPQSSAPARWFFDADPIWYRWMLVPHGLRGFVAIGNPLLWWGGAIGLIALAVSAVRRRSRLLALPVLLVVCLYVPWMATSRTTYLYYMAPIVPFLALALSRALSLARSRAAVTYAAATAVPTALWLPFLAALTVPFGYYHAVMLMTAWR